MINNLWSDREAVFPPCNRRASVPLPPNITTTHRRVFEHQYSIFTTVSHREYIECRTIVTQRRSNHKSSKITGSFKPQDWGYQPCKARVVSFGRLVLVLRRSIHPKSSIFITRHPESATGGWDTWQFFVSIQRSFPIPTSASWLLLTWC